MARKYKISILLLILMLALGIVLEQKIYGTGKVLLKKSAEEIFQSAVNKVFDKQYQELELSFDYRFSKSESQFSNCIITNANEQKIIDIDNNKETKYIATSFHKKMEHTILARENSILVDSLSLSWNQKLQEAGIASKNAIRVYLKLPKDTVCLISGDSTLCSPKYKITDTFYTGLSDEIEIEAFIHYSWATVMKRSSSSLIVISLFVLCSIPFMSFILFFRKKDQKSHIQTLDIKNSNEAKTPVLGNIRYELHQFYVSNKEIQVRPQSASLLLFLLQKPNYYATKHEIIIHLWKAENIGVETRLRRAISDLRSLLKEKSVNIEISTEEDGYRLIVQN